MKLKYALVDEDGNGGQLVSLRQGEIKRLDIFLFEPTGKPYVFPTITEIVLKISTGASGTPLTKKLSDSEITKLTSSELSGTIGFRIPLSAADTALLPVSSTLGMSLEVTNSTTAVDKQDFPASLDVSRPLVS